MRFMMFTKHLQEWPLARAGAAIRELGFDGADLTVRPHGFVEPANVRSDLPVAVKTLEDAGLQVPLITSAIIRASDPAATPTFEAAAACGVPEIKLGYVTYGEFGTFRATLDQVAQDLDGIEALARRTGVRANLHIHSDAYVTAMAPVVWWLIKDRDPMFIGAYADPGHMTVEGGGDGWRIGLDLLGPRIALVAIKDLAWEQVEDPERGKPRWATKMVPLRRGMVNWPGVVQCLRTLQYDGWLSFHSEYQGGHSWKKLTTDEVVGQTREDLAYFKSLL
jgi:sugar phosphate isomerase/epimerase